MQDIFGPEGMDVWYEGSKTWLVTDRVSDGFLYEEAMMCNQNSSALLPFQVRYQDSKKYYLYDITGKVSLKAELARSPASQDQVLQIIKSLIRVCDAVQEYLLDTGSLLLDPAYIFLDLSEALLSFILIPGRQGDFMADIQELAARLLAGADHQSQDCVLLVYDFFRLVREPDFCLAGMKRFAEDAAMDMQPEPAPFQASDAAEELLLTEAGEKGQERYAENTAAEKKGTNPVKVMKVLLLPAVFAGIVLLILVFYMNGSLAEICLLFDLPLDARWLALGFAGISGGLLLLIPALFGKDKAEAKKYDAAWPGQEEDRISEDSPLWSDDEPLWAEDEATQLLSLPPQVVLRRQGPSGGEDLIISCFPAVIGCGREADVNLGGAGVSRRHALLGLDGGRVFLCDAGSTNGTFVGGRRLKKDESVFLNEGDEIMLANIRFKYQKVSS